MQQRRTVAGTRFVPKTVAAVPEQQEAEAPSNADLAEALYRAEAERELDEEEELFNVEESISRPTSYNWEDKYRPRKPRYFNRVHTGYEWNKYNQTHYEYVIGSVRMYAGTEPSRSTDNPPPKVVQGYKVCSPRMLLPRGSYSLPLQFNIFYPDLIDKSKAPTYKIVKEPGNDETVLLHFSAGPPYEDLAFRIVNREWEFSHKRWVYLLQKLGGSLLIASSSGFRSSFDRGCLSLWFNFRRNVSLDPHSLAALGLTCRHSSIASEVLVAFHLSACIVVLLVLYTIVYTETRIISPDYVTYTSLLECDWPIRALSRLD